MKTTSRITLQGFKDDPNLFVICENGKDVLNGDAIRCGVSKEIKRELFTVLRAVAKTTRTEGIGALELSFGRDVLKRIDRQENVKDLNFWEARSDAHGGRIFFLLIAPNVIIVSAVNKFHYSQSQAVNRGIKRWKTLLKQSEKRA